jgi:hypothetical protein
MCVTAPSRIPPIYVENNLRRHTQEISEPIMYNNNINGGAGKGGGGGRGRYSRGSVFFGSFI